MVDEDGLEWVGRLCGVDGLKVVSKWGVKKMNIEHGGVFELGIVSRLGV